MVAGNADIGGCSRSGTTCKHQMSPNASPLMESGCAALRDAVLRTPCEQVPGCVLDVP